MQSVLVFKIKSQILFKKKTPVLCKKTRATKEVQPIDFSVGGKPEAERSAKRS